MLKEYALGKMTHKIIIKCFFHNKLRRMSSLSLDKIEENIIWPIALDLFLTYRNLSQLLLHLVQFVLLAGSWEQRGGITTLHSINLDWRLNGHTRTLIKLFFALCDVRKRSVLMVFTLTSLAAGLTTVELNCRTYKVIKSTVWKRQPLTWTD